MLKEFREFIERGSVLDLAVAVIIGSAFAKIISSLVTDILTPLIGLIVGGINISGLSITLGDAVITWGAFVQSIFYFLVIAFVIFLIVRTANKMKKTPPPADPTTKECKFCYSTISIKATRCPNCTSQLT